MSVAIRVQNLSKRYRLGQLGRKTFVSDWKRRLFLEKEPEDGPDVFWALRDVSFDIHNGEVVAVIGHNGAGKSTLLKILSSITTPSHGAIKLRGRVASLLEVGTGFHPELTGRENVFLNGAILGMSQKEVAKKFDEIVDFSGVEQFIDTPLKRYSSGMRVRLAFAVAAHLDPEILVIDEVLAVGDASFQKKCLGKIGEVAGAGRTVLFVSHNAAAVEALCKRGIVLDHGKLRFDGTQTDALAFYANLYGGTSASLEERIDRSGSGDVRLTRIELRDAEGKPLGAAQSGQDIELWLHFQSRGERHFPNLTTRLHITTPLGAPVFMQSNYLAGTLYGELPERGVFVCRIPQLPLPSAVYRIEYLVASDGRLGEPLDTMKNAFDLNVDAGNFYGTGRVPPPNTGVCLVQAHWRVEQPHE
jgi:lipopolysaccharide transport system ATP-binding protein